MPTLITPTCRSARTYSANVGSRKNMCFTLMDRKEWIRIFFLRQTKAILSCLWPSQAGTYSNFFFSVIFLRRKKVCDESNQNNGWARWRTCRQCNKFMHMHFNAIKIGSGKKTHITYTRKYLYSSLYRWSIYSVGKKNVISRLQIMWPSIETKKHNIQSQRNWLDRQVQNTYIHSTHTYTHAHIHGLKWNCIKFQMAFHSRLFRWHSRKMLLAATDGGLDNDDQ